MLKTVFQVVSWCYRQIVLFLTSPWICQRVVQWHSQALCTRKLAVETRYACACRSWIHRQVSREAKSKPPPTSFFNCWHPACFHNYTYTFYSMSVTEIAFWCIWSGTLLHCAAWMCFRTPYISRIQSSKPKDHVCIEHGLCTWNSLQTAVFGEMACFRAFIAVVC